MTPAAASGCGRSRGSRNEDAEATPKSGPEEVGPTTPPLDGDGGSSDDDGDDDALPQAPPEVRAEELMHLREQLELATTYFGAASDIYLPVVPCGTAGIGAAASAATFLPRPRPPAMASLSPQTRLDIVLQPLDPAAMQDTTGGAAKATAFAVYSKIRCRLSGLTHCSRAEGGRGGGGATAFASVVGAKEASHAHVLASSSGTGRCLHEPSAVLSPGEADASSAGVTLHPSAAPSTPSCSLHCSYAWHIEEADIGADMHAARLVPPSSLRVLLSMAWTDGVGELLEVKAAVLSCCGGPTDTGATRNERLEGAGRSEIGVDASAAREVCSLVLEESLMMLRRADAAAAGNVVRDGEPRPDREGSERPSISAAATGSQFLAVTKAGAMGVFEAASWKRLLARERREAGGAILPPVIVVSLDEASSFELDPALKLPRGDFWIPSTRSRRPQEPPETMQIFMFPAADEACSEGRLLYQHLTLVYSDGAAEAADGDEAYDDGHSGLRQKRKRGSSEGAINEGSKAARIQSSDVGGLGTQMLVKELHALSVLNASMHSLGRVRQVSMHGTGWDGCLLSALDGQVGPLFGRAVMPLHCCVASRMLSLCVACEEVVEGRVKW